MSSSFDDVLDAMKKDRKSIDRKIIEMAETIRSLEIEMRKRFNQLMRQVNEDVLQFQKDLKKQQVDRWMQMVKGFTTFREQIIKEHKKVLKEFEKLMVSKEDVKKVKDVLTRRDAKAAFETKKRENQIQTLFERLQKLTEEMEEMKQTMGVAMTMASGDSDEDDSDGGDSDGGDSDATDDEPQTVTEDSAANPKKRKSPGVQLKW